MHLNSLDSLIPVDNMSFPCTKKTIVEVLEFCKLRYCYEKKYGKFQDKVPFS